MFTGIIEEVGTVSAIEVHGEKRRLTVSCSKLLPELKQGDSISVSGVCLTAVDLAEELLYRGPRPGNMEAHVVLAYPRRSAG